MGPITSSELPLIITSTSFSLRRWNHDMWGDFLCWDSPEKIPDSRSPKKVIFGVLTISILGRGNSHPNNILGTNISFPKDGIGYPVLSKSPSGNQFPLSVIGETSRPTRGMVILACYLNRPIVALIIEQLSVAGWRMALNKQRTT